MQTEVILKRVIYVIVTVAVLSCAAGCRQNRNTAAQNRDGLLNVTATIFPAYDFVRIIAGDRVNLSMLLSPGAESHSFEPSPRDIITIQNSDIFIYTGGESEIWVERILHSMDTDNMIIFAMMDAVEVVEEEIVEGMEHDHHFVHFDNDDDHHDGHDDHHDDDHHDEDYEHDHHDTASYDEHVWTSPRNAILIVRKIAGLLSEADPDNAAYYFENAAAYIEELIQLDAAFAEAVAGAARRTIVFGDRFPFRYLVDAYELNYFAAFPGCSTETEPSAATVAFLINKIRAERIPVVFHIELSNEKMANTISGETGTKKLLLHSVHNISRRDFDAGLGYLELMRRNVENLREALR